MVLKKVEHETVIQKKQALEEKPVFIKIVKELPMQEVRQIEEEDRIIQFKTIEEYLTEQANAGFQ